MSTTLPMATVSPAAGVPPAPAASGASPIAWDAALGDLLERLSAAQKELLALLSSKRDLILRRDHQGLASLAPREDELARQLRQCQEDRRRLLEAASAEGLPADSISALATAVTPRQGDMFQRPLAEARSQARIIRHECLTQWVVFQRSLLHLSQLLEIIATGGRLQPTYGKGPASECGGALIDRAV